MKERLSNDDDGGDGLLLNTTATITTKNTITNFQPIVVSVEDFFHDEPSLPWKALPSHTLEQSPCYPIIGKKGKFYHCKLHPNEERNVHLDTIEQHCKYNDPELHKAEIVRLQQQQPVPSASSTQKTATTQPYRYPCSTCRADSMIHEIKRLPDGGHLMKAVHSDPTITEEHTWEEYDAF